MVPNWLMRYFVENKNVCRLLFLLLIFKLLKLILNWDLVDYKQHRRCEDYKSVINVRTLIHWTLHLNKMLSYLLIYVAYHKTKIRDYSWLLLWFLQDRLGITITLLRNILQNIFPFLLCIKLVLTSTSKVFLNRVLSLF